MVHLPFDQVFAPHDLIVVGVLIILEGALSVDNALVLGLLARRLPPEHRKKALTYGLVGAFVFRVAAIGFAAWLLHYPVVKLLGGGYLIYVAVKHFFFEDAGETHEKSHVRLGPDGHPILDEEADTGDITPEHREQQIHQRSPLPQSGAMHRPDTAESGAPATGPVGVTPLHVVRKYAKFWPTVFVIEMTDIAFAVDSILAALASIPPNPNPDHVNPKLWVVMLGGFIGVVLMRFAAVIFIKLLEKFPRFEVAAYLLVTVIGLKLVIDWAGNHYFASPENPHPVDFHNVYSAPFWIFWAAMLICFGLGFIRKKQSPALEAGRPQQEVAK